MFIATLTGALYALDRNTGCTQWGFKADAGIRSGLSVEDVNGALAVFNRIVTTLFRRVDAGAGRPASHETDKASWIEVQPIKKTVDLWKAQMQFALGLGELSTLPLAKEIQADLVSVDDLGARRLARVGGIKVQEYVLTVPEATPVPETLYS